jgi:hypothetical protein
MSSSSSLWIRTRRGTRVRLLVLLLVMKSPLETFKPGSTPQAALMYSHVQLPAANSYYYTAALQLEDLRL